MLKHSRDFNLMRECVLGSALSPYTPAYDLQQACGTGLQSTIAVANGIALGQYDSGVAGGVDTTSDAPIAFGDDLRRVLLGLRRAKSNVDTAQARRPAARGASASRSRPTASPAPACRWVSTPPSPPRRWASSASTRTRWPRPATRTWPPPTTAGSSTTSSPRSSGCTATTTCAPTRRPRSWPSSSRSSACKNGDATMTAGNSTPLTDGASVALLSSEEWAAERNLPVLAYFVDGETAAVDYVNGPDGLLMAPTYAVPRLLARNGLTLQDFDYYEIHEAFASVVLATLRGVGVRGVLQGAARPGRRAGLASTGPSSTSTARRWRRVTRSPRPAGASSRSWPSSSRRRRPRRAGSRCAA